MLRQLRQIRADGHAPVIGDCSGNMPIQTQLRKRCAELSFDRPGWPPPVGARLIIKLRRFDHFTDALAARP